MRTILIDPGHGGEDAGRVEQGVRECDLNMLYSLHTAQELIGMGHRVELTRYVDEDVSLAARVEHEHRIQPDLFLSIHCNGFKEPSAHGMEVFTSRGQTASDVAAQYIIEEMRQAFPSRRFRVDLEDGDADREAGYYVLKNTRCPAVLVEAEFMSNPEALTFLLEPGTALRMGVALAKGVDTWLKGSDDVG